MSLSHHALSSYAKRIGAVRAFQVAVIREFECQVSGLWILRESETKVAA
jgi:hypothetical protein